MEAIPSRNIMVLLVENAAPGWPGIAPRWTSSAKEGVGTSASYQSRVWFTISHGILNEVYYPRIDQANTRDMGFLVADGDQFFSEEKRDTNRRISPLEQGVPVGSGSGQGDGEGFSWKN